MSAPKAFVWIAAMLTIELIGATAFGFAQQLPTERRQTRTVQRRRQVSHPVSQPRVQRVQQQEETDVENVIPTPRPRPANAENCDQQPMNSTVRDAQHTLAAANAANANHPLKQSFINKLDAVATANAKKCRRAARFRGGQMICGNSSKGLCATAVRETLNAVGIPMGRGNAIDQKSFLHKNLIPIAEGSNLSADLCQKATPGVVCLYSTSRHNYGHIEIKTAPGKFCSDYCAGHAAILNPRGKFRLVGVYRIKQD